MTIAVCDDEKEICSLVENLLKEILEDSNIDYEIDVFYTGESLCREMERTAYQLLFLDIELPDINGVDIGRYIRETKKDEKVQIAYISSKERYALALFDYRPINFLIKPLDKEKIKKVVDKYFIVTEQEEHLFTYKRGYDFYHIPLADIMYFTSEGRKIIIAAINGTDSFYGKMDDVYSFVKQKRFLYIHKSVIVNYNYIKKIGYAKVDMINGEEFDISQSRRKIIKEMHMKLKKEEMGWNI